MRFTNSIRIHRINALTDYVLMMKPELTLLSVSTAVCSAYIALHGSVHYILLVHTLIGTMFIGGAAGVLNQYIERRLDALMQRTEHRPLPSGRIQPTEALLFGIVLGVAGLSYLTVFTNWVAVSLSVLILVSYLVIYTPLKRKTPFATVVGGIPGALPPLIGWAIVEGRVSMEAWSLFFVLFFWQMPHFLSLAWIFRNDYARANYKLLTVLDRGGAVTGRQILIYSIALIPASLMPMLVGLAGVLYSIFAFIFTVGFLVVAFRFYQVRINSTARNLFFSSLVLLPALFFFMLIF